MKTILFYGENIPQEGATYVVKEVYSCHDGCYGPLTAVILEPVSFYAGIQPKIELRDYSRIFSRMDYHDAGRSD